MSTPTTRCLLCVASTITRIHIDCGKTLHTVSLRDRGVIIVYQMSGKCTTSQCDAINDEKGNKKRKENINIWER